MQHHAILGLFGSYAQAQAAIAALEQHGIAPQSIEVIAQMDELGTAGARAHATGPVVVSIPADGPQQLAERSALLEQLVPIDIGTQVTTWRGQGPGHALQADVPDGPAAETGNRAMPAPAHLAPGESIRIPVIAEELRIDKRIVQRGCVQVFQRIEDIPVHERVALRVERLLVERHAPGCAGAADADANGMQTTYELREYAEEPVVRRVPRVIEEIVIGSQVTERVVEIEDVVRRAQVEVRRIGPAA